MKIQSSHDYCQALMIQADKDFSDHILVEREDDKLTSLKWWSIMYLTKEGTLHPFYAADIIALRDRRIFVGGDIDDCIFGYGPTDTYARLRWVAFSNLDYITEKARMGMTDNGKLTTIWKPEVAAYELQQQLKEETDHKNKAILEEAIERCLDNADEYEIARFLYDDHDWDIELMPSKVPSSRVIYAQAAVRKLCQLLKI